MSHSAQQLARRRRKPEDEMQLAASELLGLNEDDFSCPICMSMIKDPFVTDCGHTFCYQCITMHLQNKKSCPSCSTYVTADKIHPNFLLAKVLGKVREADLGSRVEPSARVVQLLVDDKAQLKLAEVNKLLQVLWERKVALEQQDAESNLQLLLHFLRHSKQQKAKQLRELQSELQLLDSDIKQVAARQPNGNAPSDQAPAHQQPLMARQSSTQLLQDRLQEAMGPVVDATHHTADTAQAKAPLGSASHAQTLQAPAGSQIRPAVRCTPPSSASSAQAGSLQQQISAAAAAAAAIQPQPASTRPGIVLAHEGNNLQPALSDSQQPAAAAAVAAASAAAAGQPSQPRLSRTSNGYLMIAHPYPSPAAQAQQHSSMPVTAETSTSAAAAAAVSSHPPAVPLPTQMERQHSMQIHPRHLAFQHFHQQQAALQQPAGQGSAGPGPGHSAAAGASPPDEMPPASMTQEAAVRARRRRVLSQFEDLQQCYLRLRKAGKSAAPTLVPPLPSKQPTTNHPATDNILASQQPASNHHTDDAAANGSASQLLPAKQLVSQQPANGAAASSHAADGSTASKHTFNGAAASCHTVNGSTASKHPATDAAAKLLPSNQPANELAVSKQPANGSATNKHRASDTAPQLQPRPKRAKKEQGVVLQPPADSSAVLDPLSNGNGSMHSANAVSARTSASPKGNASSQTSSKDQSAVKLEDPQSSQSEQTAAAVPGQQPSEVQGQQHSAAQGQQASAVTGPAADESLAEFSRMLSVFTHCGRLKVTAQLLRPSNQHSSSILSSIEFDRDSEVFATAGVSKRISIYEYSAIMANPGAETHCPSQELVTRSKLSCLSWNKYLKTYLASSDYEGVVHVWDIHTGQNVAEYEAHEKRIWSVDFCHTDPMLLMSGSDDGMVKIWSTNQANHVAEIDIKANVCCAKYNTESMYEIAVGAADHTVLSYDLRKSDKAVHVFKGHRKAVSYVRFLNGSELVSASTDSTLRLWDTKTCTPVRTFSGHNNEKNFVGLSVDSDFIACGSETNEVYVYYKAMCKPVCRRFFSTAAEVASNSHGQDPSQFISAVCWKPHSQILLSANSQGTIKLMQLTS